MEIVPVCVTPNGNRNANEYDIPYLQVCAPVDFYMDYIHYDDHSNPVDMSFRINFEDTESGKDYDEDVIVQYHMWFDNKDPAKAYVSVRGFYSDGYAPQHFRYTVTGVRILTRSSTWRSQPTATEEGCRSSTLSMTAIWIRLPTRTTAMTLL